MSQFILSYLGDGPKPKNDVARIRRHTGVVLLNDVASDSAVLVEAEPATIQNLIHGLPRWRAFENRRHKLITDVGFTARRKRAVAT